MSYLFKYAGVMAVVLCLSALGFLKSYSKREQIKRLKDIDLALSRADDMLRISAKSREEILGECFGKEVCTGKYIALPDKAAGEINAALDRFFSEFGSGDLKLEHSRINRIKRELAEFISAQEAEYAQFGKIWRAAGVCAGLCLGIMLF